jgi:FkbM family methyltransferase
MRGSAACLKWSFRDLQNLEATMPFVKDRRVAIQAGGNLGLFPKRMSEDFEIVHSFEPDAHLFACMKYNAPEKNIKMYLAALGCSRDPIDVVCSRRGDSRRSVHEGLTHVTGKGKIPQMLIDDMDLASCGLIYLDIEGYEKNALMGGIETINRFKPVIAVEINRNINYYGATQDQFRSWIIELGYKRAFSMNSDEVFIPC